VPTHWPAWEVPNFSDWRLGDIVLVGAQSGFSLVKLAQLTHHNPLMQAGAHWTHAGIYVGNGDIVDAVFNKPSQVVRQSVWNYCHDREIRIKRIASPKIPSQSIAQIAAVAQTYVGSPYSGPQTILAWLGRRAAQLPDAEALYCSTVVALAVAQATGVNLAFPRDCQPVFPAILAVHPYLADVQLEWRLA
jgi:uncharacterized protein YycO